MHCHHVPTVKRTTVTLRKTAPCAGARSAARSHPRPRTSGPAARERRQTDRAVAQQQQQPSEAAEQQMAVKAARDNCRGARGPRVPPPAKCGARPRPDLAPRGTPPTFKQSQVWAAAADHRRRGPRPQSHWELHQKRDPLQRAQPIAADRWRHPPTRRAREKGPSHVAGRPN